MEPEKDVKLSVVITAYTVDRLNDVLKLLDNLKAQTYQNFEVIIVIEGSKLLSHQIESHINQIQIANTELIFNRDEGGASASRNIGIRKSGGEIIAFIDDDALPLADWAEKMVESYTSEDIIGVTGPAVPLWEDTSMSWFPDELHWILSCTSWFECNEIIDVRHAWFQNASFAREAFATAGYLDEALGPKDSAGGFKQRESAGGIIAEDLELSLRVKKRTGKRIIYNPAVKVWHKVDKKRLTVKYIRLWAYWMGSSKREVKRLYPQKDKNILDSEQQLLKRILFRLFPDIFKTFFTHPVVAWHKLRVTVVALFFVALGYLSSGFTARKA